MLALVLFDFKGLPTCGAFDQTTSEVSFRFDILRRCIYTFSHLYNKIFMDLNSISKDIMADN